MRSAIGEIDFAIKDLYALSAKYKAEHFVIRDVHAEHAIGTRAATAALVVQDRAAEDELCLGIYLSTPVQKVLSDFRHWEHQRWTAKRVGAFLIAVEEVSHFNFLIYRHLHNRPVSHIELEAQAEIDKFILLKGETSTACG